MRYCTTTGTCFFICNGYLTLVGTVLLTLVVTSPTLQPPLTADLSEEVSAELGAPGACPAGGGAGRSSYHSRSRRSHVLRIEVPGPGERRLEQSPHHLPTEAVRGHVKDGSYGYQPCKA